FLILADTAPSPIYPLSLHDALPISVVEISAESATVEGGRGCLERVLAAGVTAVHTFNDLVAIGLMTACRAEGVSIPEQLSIVGKDRKSTRLNSSHVSIAYAVFCLKK